MRRQRSVDEIGERWTLGPQDLALLAGLPDAGKLGLAAQLAHWRQYGRFPEDEADLAPAVVERLAAQIGVGADVLDVGADVLDGYDWTGRTGRRHRRLVRDHLAVAAFDEAAEAALRRWVVEEALPREPAAAVLEAEIDAWFARGRVIRRGAYRLDRILRSARAAHVDAAPRACGRAPAPRGPPRGARPAGPARRPARRRRGGPAVRAAGRRPGPGRA